MKSPINSTAGKRRAAALFRSRTVRVAKFASLPVGWHRSRGTLRPLAIEEATLVDAVTVVADASTYPPREIDLDATQVDIVVPVDIDGLDAVTVVDAKPPPIPREDKERSAQSSAPRRRALAR